MQEGALLALPLSRFLTCMDLCIQIPESIGTLAPSCAHLLQLNAQPGQILSKVGASLISLPHVDLHEVQLGFMRRQPPLQLSTLLSPLVLLHLQEPSLSSAHNRLQQRLLTCRSDLPR